MASLTGAARSAANPGCSFKNRSLFASWFTSASLHEIDLGHKLKVSVACIPLLSSETIRIHPKLALIQLPLVVQRSSIIWYSLVCWPSRGNVKCTTMVLRMCEIGTRGTARIYDLGYRIADFEL